MATKVDPTDPAVRQLVYKHYRGILGKYNEKANSIVSTLPRDRVRQDQGITDKLESMIRQSNQIQNNCSEIPAPAPLGNGPPPPPPPPCAGSLPAVRIASEIGPRRCEPPAAIQNAMMTKDKKPFTYTPGGLNLNEIRSPRMARRISRNAHTEDSCSPQVQAPHGPVSPPGPLPPAALAAMQPQIAIPVFPPGGVPPAPPPPPPPAQQASAVVSPPPAQSAGIPPPPPPLPTQGVPTSPPTPVQAPLPTISPSNMTSRPHDFPRPEFLSDIASHPPLRPVGQLPRSSYEPAPPPPLQVQLKPVSPKPSPEPQSTQQLPFVPKLPVDNAQYNSTPTFQAHVPQVTTPPIQPATPPLVNRIAPSTPPIVPSQQARTLPTPPIQQVRAPSTPPVGQRQPATPPLQAQRTPPTPPLNKSPAPWLTSKPTQKESLPPWTVRQSSVEAPSPTPAQQPTQASQHTVTRVIPIQLEGREPAPPPKAATPSPQPYYNQTQTPQHYAPPTPPQHYGPTSPQLQAPQTQSTQHRYIQPPPNFPNYGPPPSPQPQVQYAPPQYQMPNQQIYSQPQPPQMEQGRTRIIPIQIEGADNGKAQPAYYSQNSCPTGNAQTRNQNGDAVDSRKFQTQSSYSGNPTQSRSFRVLQKITGSDDDAQERLDESEY